MSATFILLFIAGYFILLFVISWITGRKSDAHTFFIGNKTSPWFLVAFGMVGASLSGITFISIPGWVGNSQFSYMQLVLGNFLGYILIACILLPLYYRLNLTSIYTYLEKRLGLLSYKTGAAFFIISRVIGASFRLYLVAMVLQEFVFKQWQIPFWLTVLMTIAFIWIYTFRGGIKTIVWTDTLQTLFMLLAVVMSLKLIAGEMNLSLSGMAGAIADSKYSQIFFWDFKNTNYFWKQFLSGAFIAIVMTGLDQDMMQKNLSCRNIKSAQKNMIWFSVIFVIMSGLFLCLGALLYLYANANGIEITGKTSDTLFPMLALHYFGPVLAAVFILGLIAAAYSSADSALTALTTSFCIDFLNFGKRKENKRTRYLVHLGFSIVLLIVIILFRQVHNEAIIKKLFEIAGYTYGPLLGLFSFGLFTKLRINDRLSPFICISCPVICYFLKKNSPALFSGYEIGFELLIINGIMVFAGLLIFAKR